MDVDQLVVVAIDEVALLVEHIGKAAGHAGTEVDAGTAQHHDHAAGHVFAAMIAHTFDHGVRAGVAHREALAGQTRRIQGAAGGAVQAGVADDHGIPGVVARILGRTDHDAAAGHALADEIVGVAVEFDVQATRVPYAETLPGRTLELERDRLVAHAEIAVTACDLTGQACADRTVPVLYGVVEHAAGLVLDCRQRVLRHRLGQLALVEGLVVEHAVVRAVQRHAGRFENRRQIQTARLAGLRFDDLQQIGAADQFRDRTHTELRQTLTRFLGDEAEVVGDHFRQADEMVETQHAVLRGDAGGAVVEMADAQVLAAQRHHRRGAEAEALGAEDRGLDHVQTGLETAVGLHPHFVAQIVHAQRLMGFGQAQLPRRAGVLDRGQRAGAGATVIAGDRDQVGIGLGHAGRDRADTGAGHQLDRDQCLGVDLLEVEDQLRQILDRVDVVMRRRADQRNAGLGIAQRGDHVVDLVARQLSAFARLGALRDLDLQHLGIDQIGRRDAEAAARHLLDLGHLVGAVARRVFAAFAGIAAAAEAVHRHRQRLVRLRRQRAQRHAGRIETPQDRLHRLDVLDRDRMVGIDAEQIANRRHRAFVHGRRVDLIVLVAPALDGALQGTDHIRVVGMVFAAVHVLVQAALFDRLACAPGQLGETVLLGLQIIEA